MRPDVLPLDPLLTAEVKVKVPIELKDGLRDAARRQRLRWDVFIRAALAAALVDQGAIHGQR